MNVHADPPASAGALAGEAYCPHCYLPVESGVAGPWPPAPQRCPHCRLMIGAGRARQTPDGIPGARGAAAGVMRKRAQEVGDAIDHTDDEILAAIRHVARGIGVAPERLLMVDYQQYAVHDHRMPQLHELLSRYGSWKHARREAALAA